MILTKKAAKTVKINLLGMDRLDVTSMVEHIGYVLVVNFIMVMSMLPLFCLEENNPVRRVYEIVMIAGYFLYIGMYCSDILNNPSLNYRATLGTILILISTTLALTAVLLNDALEQPSVDRINDIYLGVYKWGAFLIMLCDYDGWLYAMAAFVFNELLNFEVRGPMLFGVECVVLSTLIGALLDNHVGFHHITSLDLAMWIFMESYHAAPFLPLQSLQLLTMVGMHLICNFVLERPITNNLPFWENYRKIFANVRR